MIGAQFILPIAHELVIDLFAGGGGASTGIEQALGRHVDIAVNHDPEAVSLHAVNHPQTRHFCEDVFKVDPLAVTEGRPVGLLWASPDCKHFSSCASRCTPSPRRTASAWSPCTARTTSSPTSACACCSRESCTERRGFPDSYAIERGADGRIFSKASQVRMCGNSVCPPLARAMVAANFSEFERVREAA